MLHQEKRDVSPRNDLRPAPIALRSAALRDQDDAHDDLHSKERKQRVFDKPGPIERTQVFNQTPDEADDHLATKHGSQSEEQ